MQLDYQIIAFIINKDGKNIIYQRQFSSLVPYSIQEGMTAKRIIGMCKVKDALRKVFDVQLNDGSDEKLLLAQERLNQEYDNFIKKYGYINDSVNGRAFDSDPDYYLLTSIENKVSKDDEDIKIFNLEMTGLSPNSCTILLQYFASLYNAITKSNEVYEDSGNVIGVNYDKEDNEIISKFEKLDFNEKLDLFSEIIIKYDNEIYFDEKITMLSFDSELSGFDIAKQMKDFKN